MSEGSYRCWICLEDADTLDGMISPCSCVGTNRWVHEDCLKTFCLQHLASHSDGSPKLRVACPICRTEYQITTQQGSAATDWRELFRWSSTDHQLLLRHARFLFLVAPLVCSSLVAWTWLAAYWDDLYRNGPGEALMEGGLQSEPSQGTHGLRGLMVSLPRSVSQFIDANVMPFLPIDDADDATVAEALREAAAARPRLSEHPSGISQNWSRTYVWLQYAQWYKVLCWLLVLVLGGSEGLVPASMREAFRVEELLFTSEMRAQVFIFGQCVPFVLTKTRHFLVTWAGSSHVVRLVFYSAFTSHVEVASTLACDTVVSAHLLYDWMSSAVSDYTLRMNLNRLRLGHFAIASIPRPELDEGREAGAAADRLGAGGAQRRAGASAAAAANHD